MGTIKFKKVNQGRISEELREETLGRGEKVLRKSQIKFMLTHRALSEFNFKTKTKSTLMRKLAVHAYLYNRKVILRVLNIYYT